jgi:type IV pilus assembly protein PilE
VKMRRNRGFTLIELMVVLAVIAIIAAIAVPAFTKQVQRSHRADAVRGVSDLQLRQERWRASNATYAADLATLLGSAATATNYNSASDYYTFTTAPVAATPGSAYTVTATPKGVQASDAECNPMTLTVSNGVVSKSPSPSSTRCWN